MVGGAAGVAAAIATAIAVQLFLFPTAPFSPNSTLLTLVATTAGALIAWLLGQGLRQLHPHSDAGLADKGLRVILVFSVLVSLLQSLLFTHGF